MSVISTIREKLSRKERDQRERELQDYNELVVAVADGKEPSEEDIERLLTGGTAERPKLLCPKCPTNVGDDVSILKTKGNVQSCICQRCGEEFKREYDPDAEQVIGRTVQDLERDVELLRRRRQWAEDLTRLPELVEAEGKLREKLEKARAKARKAIAEQQRVAEEVAPELQTIERQKRDAERAQEQLQSSCRDVRVVEEYERLEKRRRELVRRKQNLKVDLWGYSPVGKLTDPVHDSTGAKLLALQQKVERVASNGKHQDRTNLENYQRQLVRVEQQEFNPRVREFHQLGEQLEQIDARMEELRQQMLEP